MEIKMDFGILYALNNIHTDLLDKIMIGLTYLGEKGIFWIAISIILLFNSKTRKCGIFMLISMTIRINNRKRRHQKYCCKRKTLLDR